MSGILTFHDALIFLDVSLNQEQKDKISTYLNVDDFIRDEHYNLGLWLRNELRFYNIEIYGGVGLWFFAMGVDEPDSMSSILLEVFYYILKKTDYNLEKILKKYK